MFDPKRAKRVDVKRHRCREKVREMNRQLRHWHYDESEEIFEEEILLDTDNGDKVNLFCSVNRGHLYALNKRR
jgi:hypothetical protein